MKLHKVCWLFPLLSFGMMWSCSSPPQVKSELAKSPQETQATFLPEYRLGFGDVVEIKVFENERFNETVSVRPDGRITLQKMDDILVKGMSPSQLDSLITAAYAKFMRNPEITVFVRQFGGYQVYVLGEVNAPGGYPLQRDMSILQAIATAGGFKESATRQNVMLLRPGRQHKINAFKLDLSGAVHGNFGRINADEYYMQALDVIYVPKTFISSTVAFLKQIYDGVLPPLDIYLRAVWWRGW